MKKNRKIILTLFSIILICNCEKDVKEDVSQAPTCYIISPNNGQEIQLGTTVTISVDANDSDGNVVEVRFYVDDSVVDTLFSYPYNYEWNTSEEELGIHTIKARAKDDRGNIAIDEIIIEIFSLAPITEFSSNKTEIEQDTQITFNDESTNNPTSWSWDFGDGGTSTIQNPTHTYSSLGNFTVSLISTNNYGSDSIRKEKYITVSKRTFTDSRDGNEYTYVSIGNQIWMAENLNYKTSSGSWVYNNNSSYAASYGRLYDWGTANNVCPSGWHLPSDDEWIQLEMTIGMSPSDAYDSGWRGTDEGSKLMVTIGYGNDMDEYGFAARIAGYRDSYDGDFRAEGYYTYFWSSTTDGNNKAWYRMLGYDSENIYRGIVTEELGLSVRCVRD